MGYMSVYRYTSVYQNYGSKLSLLLLQGPSSGFLQNHMHLLCAILTSRAIFQKAFWIETTLTQPQCGQ